MNLTKHAIKRTALATAIAATLGTTAVTEQVLAANLSFNVSGWFTMINAAGNGALVNGDAAGNTMYGRRSAVTGTMTFDTVTHSGTFALQPFSFFGSGDAAATSITFEDVDGPGGASTLMLGNMGFNWNNNIGIPVSLAWDGEGILDAINQGLAVGDSIGATNADFACDTNISCATPATDDFPFSFGKFSYTLPIGASPVATTTFNTTDIGTIALGTNPSGTLPLIDDNVGGSPMKAGPFPGFNANFDFDNITVTNTGEGENITAPSDVETSVPQDPGPPKSQTVSLGTPSDVSPAGSAEYCTDTIVACNTNNSWVADGATGADNPVDVPITQTINTLLVNWRAGGGAAIATQTVTSTVDDTTPPGISSTPMDVFVDVASTSEEVCFSNDTIGHLVATDVWDSAPEILYSLNGFDFIPSDPSENCSDQLGPNANTVFWRAVDVAGNITPHEQTVTLNLPTGIVGKACVVDMAYSGIRNLAGNFTMRNPLGAQTGQDDNTVTGNIDTTLLCTDIPCADVGAALETTQPFEGLLWKAEPIQLYGEGTWTFESCPGDSSTQCDDPPPPRPVAMTVKPGQLGAHMLFKWGSTENIDVVVVWDVDCGSSQLTTTDPDGDGILGTKMVDGPFIGFNAAFDQSATGKDPGDNDVPLIAEGGFAVDVPASRNPVKGASPLLVSNIEQTAENFSVDNNAIRSCVGGCNKFETDNVLNGNDSNGAYNYIQAVFPLKESIPFWSLYRKFDEATEQWRTFTVDGRNNVKSAQRDENDFCPEPGSGDYSAADTNSNLAEKLQFGDECIQLTIEDNGPNDSNVVAGIVADPSGVAEVSSPGNPNADTTGDGCTIGQATIDPLKRSDWWLLGGLLGLLGWSRRKAK